MYKQIAANKRNTILIMIGFVVVIAALGALFAYLFDDWWISAWVLIIAVIYAVAQYFLSASLAVAMTGAKEIHKKDHPRLYNTVENLTITAGLPMPKVYIINDPAPNAFATGRDPKHAIVAATTGLLDIMDNKELTAVMAHELSHVKNYDIRVSMITFGLVCVVGLIADLGTRMIFLTRARDDEDNSPIGLIVMLLVSILAPVAASVGAELLEAVWNNRERSLTLYIDAPGGVDLAGAASNLSAATLGNLVGGVVLVGVSYWFVYGRSRAERGKRD